MSWFLDFLADPGISPSTHAIDIIPWTLRLSNVLNVFSSHFWDLSFLKNCLVSVLQSSTRHNPKKSHEKGDQKLMQMEGRSVDCPPVYGSVGQLRSSDGEKFTSLSTTFQQPWVWKQHNVDFLISSDIRFEKICTHDIWYVLIRIYIYIHIFRDKTLLWIRDVDNSYIHIYDGRSRYLKCGQS